MQLSTYQLRECLEDRDVTQQGGLNAILTAAGFKVFTRLNAVGEWQKQTPRVDLKVSIGDATGHRFVCPDGVLRYDYFNFNLGVQVVTRPRNVAANNEQHEQFLANVRQTLSAIGGTESFNDAVNFPQVYIAEYLKDSGTTDYLKEDDGLEYSTASYDGIVCIRQSAWNN